jgi:glycosyltransferase involved in cell wall biosynthesis
MNRGSSCAQNNVIEVYLLASLPPPYGGVTTWTRWFVREAPNHGVVLTLDEIGARTAPETSRWSARLARSWRGLLKPLATLIWGRARHAQVLHICVSGGLGFWRGLVVCASAMALGKRAVLHLHSRTEACSPSSLACAGWFARRGLVWVTPSREDAAVRPGLRAIENGLDLSSGREWNGPSGGAGLRLVFIGSMIRQKGLFELLDALACLPEVHLIAHGSNVRPWELDAWRARGASLGLSERVEYRGAVGPDEVREAMRRADALILPSYGESFGLVLAEAMQIGLPVIAPRVGFLRDAPDDVFFPIDDVAPSCIVASIVRAQQGKARGLLRVGAAGQAYLRERLDVESIFAGWVAAYRGSLERGESPGRRQLGTNVANRETG